MREHPFVEVFVAGRNQASLTQGDHVFLLMKAEYPDVAQRARFPSLIFRAGSVGCVFHDANPAGARQLVQSVHVGALSVKMHRQDGLGARRNLFLN